MREAQRLTTTQRNVCVAVAPGELEGKLIQPGNAIIMMLGEAGRNKTEIEDAAAFNPQAQDQRRAGVQLRPARMLG